MKILNRIVTFLLAVAVFPAAVTRIILRIIVSLGQESTVYALLAGVAEDAANSGMEITFSLQEVFEAVKNDTFSFGDMNFSISSIPTDMLVTKNWAIAAAVLLVLALVIALVIMGCALFTQAHKTVMGLAAGGVASCFAAMACFDKFAEPFINDQVDIGKFLAQSLLGNEEGLISSLGSMFMSGAVSVDVLQLGNAVITIAIIFIGILLWTFAYYITLSPEAKAEIKNGTAPKKEKNEKKLKLAKKSKTDKKSEKDKKPQEE